METIIKPTELTTFNSNVKEVQSGFLKLFNCLFPILRWETDAQVIVDIGIAYVDIVCRNGLPSTENHQLYWTSAFIELLSRQDLSVTDVGQKCTLFYEELLNLNIFEGSDDFIARIIKLLFDRVTKQVEEYRLDVVERGEWCCHPHQTPFDWKHHLHLPYFRAITVLETFVKANSSRDKTNTHSFSTQVTDELRNLLYDASPKSLMTWRSYVFTEQEMSRANKEYDILLQKQNLGRGATAEEIAIVIELYQQAEKLAWSGYVFENVIDPTSPLIRHCATAGFLNTRIALIYCHFLQDDATAHEFFFKAMRSASVDDWNAKHFHCQWANVCRVHLAQTNLDSQDNWQSLREEWNKHQRDRQAKERQRRSTNRKQASQEQPQHSTAKSTTPDLRSPDVNLHILNVKAKEVDGITSLLQLLRWIYEVFTPLDATNRDQLQRFVAMELITQSDIRNIILIYHPDKNYRYGKEWGLLCEEVTKVNNQS